MTNQTIEEIKRQAELAAEWINAKPQGEMSWYMGQDAWYRNAPSREVLAEQLIAANELLQQVVLLEEGAPLQIDDIVISNGCFERVSMIPEPCDNYEQIVFRNGKPLIYLTKEHHE